ncbi:hypothetical protein AFLA_008157 [Aspergillus flavus NRRL3357]|nr:hypothetical protein AFLA_008157 [Aspergillus flavus NRRL3357]
MLKPTLSSVLLTMTRFQGMMEDRTHGYKWETRAWLEPWVGHLSASVFHQQFNARFLVGFRTWTPFPEPDRNKRSNDDPANGGMNESKHCCSTLGGLPDNPSRENAGGSERQQEYGVAQLHR